VELRPAYWRYWSAPLHPLDWKPDDWIAAGTVMTAVVAAVAAVFAWRQVIHAARAREDQIRPFVIVYFDNSRVARTAIMLVIENIGRTIAKNVLFNFDPSLESSDAVKDFKIENSVLIQRGLTTLAPNQRIEGLFDNSVTRFGTALPMEYTVTISYEDTRGGGPWTDSYVLDLSTRYGVGRITEHGLNDVVKQLEAVVTTSNEWSSPHGGLLTWTQPEHRQANADELEHQDKLDKLWNEQHPDDPLPDHEQI
jgi:hypothetical protein